METKKSDYESVLKEMRLNLDSLLSLMGISRSTHRRVLDDWRALKKLLRSVSERREQVDTDLDAGCIRILQHFNFKCKYVFPKKMGISVKTCKTFKNLVAQLICLEVEKVRKDVAKFIRKKISQRRL